MTDRDFMDEVRSKLRISKHEIDDALEEQADILDRIGQHVTRAAFEAAAAEDRLKTTEAELTVSITRENDKLTVAAAAALVRTHQRRTSAWTEAQRCAREHASWQKLYRSWEERSYSLKGLGGLHASGYFTASSHTMPRGRGPDDAGRARMRDASNERAAERALRSAEDAGAEPRVTRRAIT